MPKRFSSKTDEGEEISKQREAEHNRASEKVDVPLPVFDDVITLVRRFDLPMTAGARALVDELRAHGGRMPPLEEVLSAG